jgi:primosomal protein N'
MGKCEKVSFSTYQEARRHLLKCQLRGWSQKSFYECPKCGNWHLTSKEHWTEESVRLLSTLERK